MKNNIISELLADSTVRRIKNEKFGVLLKDLPTYSYEEFLNTLNVKILDLNLVHPYIFFVGFSNIEINDIRTKIVDYINIFNIYFTVEDAEKFRNRGDLNFTRIVIVKRDVPKLSSLKWYERIDTRELYDDLCIQAQNQFKDINNALVNLWQAFKHNSIRDIISLDRLIDYYEFFLNNHKDITVDSVTEMYRLGLLIDEELFKSTKVDNIRKRIIENNKLVLRLRDLDKGDQRALQTSNVNKAHTIRANVLKFYKSRDNYILKELKYSDVLDILTNISKAKKKKKSQRNNNTNDTSRNSDKDRKTTDSVGVDLIIERDEEQIEDILDQIEEEYKKWENGKRKKSKIESEQKSISVEFIPEVHSLIEAFVGPATYGGIIYADVSSPIDALDSLKKNKIKPFDESFTNDTIEILSSLENEFQETEGLTNKYIDLLRKRNELVEMTHRLSDSPILKIVESEQLISTCISYISLYSKLMHEIKEKYSMFEAFSRVGTQELVVRINALDMVYIIGEKEVHAILTPLNPLYLWKYIELTRRLKETSSTLNNVDKEFLVRAAADIPNPLTTVFISNFFTNAGDFIIPEVGFLGKLPIYSNSQQVTQVADGFRETTRSIEKLISIYPHSRLGLRVGIINPPDVNSVFKIFKDLVNDKAVQGIHIHIYKTKQTPYNWASLEDVDENLLSKFGFSTNIRHSIKIDNNIYSYSDLTKVITDNEYHTIIMFDPCSRAIINNKREPRLKLKIHPLCVPNVFNYDPIADKLEIIPSSEGNIFSDYHDLIAKLNDKPRGWYHAVSLESEITKEEFDRILSNTIWLVVADNNLKKLELSAIGSKKCIYYRTGVFRDVGIYSNKWLKLTSGVNQLTREIGNYNPIDICMEQVLRKIQGLNEKGILHLTSSKINKVFDRNHAKGAIGLAISAFFYQYKFTNSLLVSLDTDLAKSWLEEREDKIFSDLIGIRFDEESEKAFIDIIEVKTYKDYAIIEQGNNVFEINGNAVEQVQAVEKMINEIFFEQDKITSTSRREILRFQVFKNLHQLNLNKSEKRFWTDRLNELFAGNIKVNINLSIYHVCFNNEGETDKEGLECHSESKITLYKLKNDIINKVFNRCNEFTIENKNFSYTPIGNSPKTIFENNKLEEYENEELEYNEENTCAENKEFVKDKDFDIEEEIEKDSFTSNREKDIHENILDEIGKIDFQLKDTIEMTAKALYRALRDYSIDVAEIDPNKALIASRFIRFRIRLRPGETLQKVQRYRTDIAREIESESDILVDNEGGSQYIYVDVPRRSSDTIKLLDNIHKIPSFTIGNLNVIIGQEPNGNIEIEDIANAPHILTAGSTGSGKTIFLYSILISLISQYNSDELELVIIDPKQTDFIFFEGLPHLRDGEVIIEPENAVEVLTDLVENELSKRTRILRGSKSRDLFSYNKKNFDKPMKPILVIIDEYADLVQVADLEGRKDEFERNIIRLAQRSRNVGIHLLIATQRPSADIVTSRLKANIPTRISFRLPAHQDSKTILDASGAEDLLGKGDMLYSKNGELKRLQGLFISEEELEKYLHSKYGI